MIRVGVVAFSIFCLNFTNGLVNVALNRPSSQSSTFDSLGVAGHGNDGRDGSRYSKNVCSRTKTETNPWWMVDLGRKTRTKSVILTKDSDPGYDLFARAFRIGLLNDVAGHVIEHLPMSSICYEHTASAHRSRRLQIKCSKCGRYLVLQVVGSASMLSFCEIEVYEAQHHPLYLMNNSPVPTGAHVHFLAIVQQSSLTTTSDIAVEVDFGYLNHPVVIDGKQFFKSSSSSAKDIPSLWARKSLASLICDPNVYLLLTLSYKYPFALNTVAIARLFDKKTRETLIAVHSNVNVVQSALLEAPSILSLDLVLSPRYASGDVVCFSNCGEYLNPKFRLVLKFECGSRCDDERNLLYAWDVWPSSKNCGVLVIDWNVDVVSGRYRDFLQVQPGSFNGPTACHYFFMVTATKSREVLSSATYSVSLPDPLPEIRCQINPKEGYALETQFEIVCASQDSRELTYRLFLKPCNSVNTDENREKWLCDSEHSHFHELYLTEGDAKLNHLVCLKVMAVNLHQTSSEVFLDVTVLPLRISQALQMLLLQNMSSHALSMMSNGILHESMHHVLDALSVLNYLKKVTVVSDEWFAKVKQSQGLLQETLDLARTSCSSLSELGIVTMAFAESTKYSMNTIVSENVSPFVNSLSGFATTLKQMATTRDTTLEDIVDISRYMVVGLSNTMTSVVHLSNGSREDKNSGMTLTETLNVVADTVQSHMTAVDNPVVIRSETISVSLVTRNPRHLPGLNVYAESTAEALNLSNISMNSRIRIPNDFDVGRYSKWTDDVHIKMLTVAHSPYTLQKNVITSLKYSSTLDVTLTSGSQPLNITNLTSPVDIFISVPVSPKRWTRLTLQMGNATYSYSPVGIKTNLIGLYLYISDEVKRVLMGKTGEVRVSVFFIQTMGLNDATQLDDEYVQKAENESVYKASIPLRDLLQYNLSIPFRILLIDEHVRETRSKQNASSIGVKLMHTLNQTFDLHVLLIELNCLHWSQAKGEWSEHGCRVGAETLPSIVHCQCTHLSIFVISFFVMPNLLDVREELLKFATVWQNPIGIIVISIVTVIYLILLIWARRADKLDEMKALPINLVDNPLDSKYAYLVTVYTGSRRGAGTSSDVAIVLKGILADSEAHILQCEEFDVLQRGSVNSFIIRTNRILGNLYAIRVWHHNTGKWPEWYLSRVVIYSPGEDVQYYFICDAWLAVDIGDCVLDKTFNAATEAEVKQFQHLFPTRTLREFDEHHLWFSIYSKPSQSTFTRVQRLTCCLSLLLTYMLSNIMFYGIQPGSNEEKMEVGFATFSWTELLIGFETCLLTFPINIFIAWLFRSIQPRKIKIFKWIVKRPTAPQEPTIDEGARPKKREGFEKKMQTGFQLESAKSPQSKRISEALAAALPHKPVRLSKISFHSCIEAEPLSVRKKKRRYLPWWMLFVAYSLVLTISIICSFFTILYTLSFGYSKAFHWMVAFLASFVYDLLIGQPLKVIALAIFFSLIFKKADIECPEDIELSEGDHRDLEFAKYVEEMRAANPLYRPPPSSLLVSARRQREMTRKMYAIVIEIVRYILFMYLVILITYSQRNPKIYWLNRFLLQTFKLDALKLMSNQTNFWNWAKGDLIKAIYDDEDPNYLPNKFSYILGAPTFRQLRVRSDSSCLAPKPLSSTRCTATFSRSTEERRDFVMSWNQSVDHTGVHVESPEATKPWLYSRQSEYGGTTWTGVVSTYGPGGYVANFSKTPNATTNLLNDLESRDWIDSHTAAIIFELYAFAPNVNLISEVTFLIEFPPFGGLLVSKSITSIKLYHYISGMHIFALVLESVFIVYTVYFLIREIENISRERKGYFLKVWNIFDVATLLVSISAIILFVVNYLESSMMMQVYGSTRAIQFHRMFQVGYFIDFLMGMLICLGMIKFLHLLRFNPLIYKFGYVFRSIGTKILMFCLVMLCIMIAFSGLLFLMTRGQVRPFKSMTESLSTHYRAILGFFDYVPVRDFDSFWIPSLYIGYSFVATYCLYSLMIAMFLHGLHEVSRRLLPNEETALLWVLIGKIKDWFGIKEEKDGPPDGRDPNGYDGVEEQGDLQGDQATSPAEGADALAETGTDSSASEGTNAASEGAQGTSAESSSAQGADTASGAVQSTTTESRQGETAKSTSLRGTASYVVKGTNTASEGAQKTRAESSSAQGADTASGAVQSTPTESRQGETVKSTSLRGTASYVVKGTSTTSDGPSSTDAVQSTSPVQGTSAGPSSSAEPTIVQGASAATDATQRMSSAVQNTSSTPTEDERKKISPRNKPDSASNQPATK